ncbi:hypothetical protein [Bradyrhizobium ivorense]|uniref:hypothetical protein n=1 Tax=Bradyrhizobium ivorense TaxID=2511166 RepID=UPI0010B90A15|nr:hypothetical protein [Bradyrhizobium ivorense]VIO73892.1 hypothetical protein CI41S_40010 [Bradyrhizobium ivorense]
MTVMIRPHFDPNGNDFAIERVQDCTPILEWNERARKEEQRSDWGRHKARIPNVVLLKWMDEEHKRGNTTLRMFSKEFDELIFRKLEDPDYFYLRVDRPALQVGWH